MDVLSAFDDRKANGNQLLELALPPHYPATGTINMKERFLSLTQHPAYWN